MGLHFGGHTTSNRDLTATHRGELRHPSLRHVGDTRQEGFAWRKTPIATGVGGTEKPQAQPAARHVSAPGAAGVEGAGGIQGQAAVPVGGGGAWPGFETKHKPHTSTPGTTGVEGAGGMEGQAAVPVGGGGAWPGFETTRRAKLAARTARGRAAAHGHTKQPGPTTHHAAPGTPVAPGTPAVPQRNEAATGCPATASSRSRSAAQQSGTAQVSAVHNSATSDQAVMST